MKSDGRISAGPRRGRYVFYSDCPRGPFGVRSGTSVCTDCGPLQAAADQSRPVQLSCHLNRLVLDLARSRISFLLLEHTAQQVSTLTLLDALPISHMISARYSSVNINDSRPA